MRKEQITFINELSSTLEELEGANLILGGDWNTVLDINIDKKGGKRGINNKQYHDSLSNIIEGFDLVDC